MDLAVCCPKTSLTNSLICHFYTPRTLWVYTTFIRPSVRRSACPSICKQNHVRPITFLPPEVSMSYLVQVFSTKDGMSCFTTFDLDRCLQGHLLMNSQKMGQRNHVCAATFLPLDGSFSYLVQTFTVKRCVM